MASQGYSGQGLTLVHARVCMGGCAVGLLVALWWAVWRWVVSGWVGLALAVWAALVGCGGGSGLGLDLALVWVSGGGCRVWWWCCGWTKVLTRVRTGQGLP